MEKVKFSWPNPVYCGDYECNKLGDQSGEYVRAEVAEKLHSALRNIAYMCAKPANRRIKSSVVQASKFNDEIIKICMTALGWDSQTFQRYYDNAKDAERKNLLSFQ
jgi:hypothetical protein